MRFQELVAALEAIAPLELAETWDNVGVIVCPSVMHDVRRALLTIDLTMAVLDEAINQRAEVIIAYHPPLFGSIKRVTPADRAGRLALKLIEHGIAVYSPHTALDAVSGGINDWLCEAFTYSEKRAIVPWAGTAVYPEPVGQGRFLTLSEPLNLEDAIYRVKQHLSLYTLRVARSAAHAHVEIHTVGLCAGAGGSVLERCEADLLLAGEMRHHDVLACTEAGTSILLTEHTNSERGYLSRLKSRLRELAPNVEVMVATTDREPLNVA
jgi:dinuclear metal center YbgI/SA1388 family protein